MTVKFGADISYFLWSVGTGFVFAMFYDFIRAVRNSINASGLVINITDIILLLGCGFVAILEAYCINNGEFRIYSILCICFAFLLYHLIIGNSLVFLLEKFLKTIAKAIMFPIKKMVNISKIISKSIIGIKDKFFSKIKIKKA